MLKLILPLEGHMPRRRTVDKKFILNLNVYRNTHYRDLDKAKKAYAELVMGAFYDLGLRGKPKLEGPLRFVYTVYPKNKQLFDIANVLSVVQKFTDDALIDLGIIEDDNYEIVREVDYRLGLVSYDDPHVELIIDGCETETSVDRQTGFGFAEPDPKGSDDTSGVS